MSDRSKYYETLFDANEATCWSKDTYGTRVVPVELALQHAEDNFVCINPLYQYIDKAPSKPTHSAAVGRRADVNVSAFRNILCEFDKGEIHEQRHIIESSGLPYSTLVYSGGKSLHAIVSLSVPCATYNDYKRLVKRVYGRLPTVDRSASNPSRFTRAPGADRGIVRQVLLDLRPRTDNESLEAWLGPEVKPEEPSTARINLPRVISPYTERFLLEGSPEGGWNNNLFRAAADMTRAGYSKHEIIHICSNITGYLDAKDLRTIDSAVNSSRKELE